MIDFLFMAAVLITVFCGVVKTVRPWGDFDPSKPLPAPPSSRWSFIGLLATLAMLVRWIAAGKPWYSDISVGFAVVSMLWCVRIAVRAEHSHQEYLRRRATE